MSATVPQDLTSAIRSHHRALADELDNYTATIESGVDQLDAAALSQLLTGITTFLSGELLPHARGEEQSLYPALDPIIKQYGKPTATMSVDHEYIGEFARQITDTARSLSSATQQERAQLAKRLERQIIQLQTLFGVHLAKEERVYLPLVEQAISAGDQQALLAALHEGAEADPASATTGAAVESLDVRQIPPAQRHPLIFQRFEALPVGGSFTLINDHDPKPLFYQLKFEYKGDLLWEYDEQGPEIWRVRVGKAS